MPDALPRRAGREEARGRPGAPARDVDHDRELQEVFEREWAPMVRLATLLLSGDQRRAEEVVQDALLGLHRSWSRLDDREACGGYLRRSVVNGCRSVHRRRAVEHRYLRLLARDDVAADDPEREGVEHELVLRALRDLPLRQREVLVLRYWQDASEAEIARALGVSAGAVKTHAHRGLAAVRAALDNGQEGHRG